MSFQDSPSGVSPTEIVASRPQSNNDSNDFIKAMEMAASSAASSSASGATSFVNYAVDGVSVEQKSVWHTECDFLSCRSNHLGSTDNNHNIKSWRYQIIGGSDKQGCTIGRYMIDSYYLRQHVAIETWLPSDFANDLLVLRLTSYETILKLSQTDTDFGSTATGDKGVLALTLFFMRLKLYSINGQDVPAVHRAVYLWCSVLWLTSIDGASMITKRNIMAEAIAFMFIVLRSDILKPRHCTSEPAEHMFGMLRQLIREFTCLEFAQLVEKQIRRLTLMYKHSFKYSRDPAKGYVATLANFFEYTRSEVDEGMCILCINILFSFCCILNFTHLVLLCILFRFDGGYCCSG